MRSNVHVMSFEVEQKFRGVDHAILHERLTALGAVAGAPLDQEDAYLSHPGRDFAKTGEALRVRTVGDWNAVTYKGPKRGGPTKTREEIEVAFAEGRGALAQVRRVFEVLGFRAVAVVRKVRTPYHLSHQGRDVEVVLDRVEGLGAFVEVEVMASDEADLPSAQAVVIDLAARLGLTDVESRSYLRMILEQASGGVSR